MVRAAWVMCLFIFFPSVQARAQATHADRLAAVAEQCLGDVVSPYQTLRLDSGGSYPFIRTHLIEAWLADGRTIYEPDTPGHPLLEYHVEGATISYERSGRRTLTRTASLVLGYGITGTDGRVLVQSTCRDAVIDEVDRPQAAALADDRYDFGRPELPPRSRLRRLLEPTVVIAASAVGTYLFFNLRSRRADN